MGTFCSRDKDSQRKPPGFSYPSLPPTDSLRVLTLHPAGEFWLPLRGSLAPVPFSSRPKYIALSYTWGDPDEDHAKLPVAPGGHSGHGSILINQQSLAIDHNVSLALRFLRSPKHPLPLWIDAICIDQSSIGELNQQVALMAFIYTRATAVISWLGAPPQVSGTAGKSFIELGEFWNAGDGRCIASQFASAIRHPPAGAPAKPFTWAWRVKNKADMRTMQSARVAANPYWQRMWIVQEVCLPQHLAFLCGGYLWTESMMWDAIKANKSVTSPYDSEVLLQVSGEAAAPAAVSEQYHATMERLLSVRSTRFSDATRLESLMEHFMDYGCQKSRDRVFGLAGLANDIEPFAVAKGAVSQSPSAMPSGTPSGTSRLEIDYTRSYYDIWCDVVAHMYFRATPLLDFGDTPNEKEDERRIRVVRFAGVVQRALDGQVEEERTLLHEAGMAAQVPREPLKVKGYIAGRILSLGPRYTEGLGCSRADQHWLASSKTYYTKAGELETLRRTEASYKTKILAYSSQDLRRICIIDSASAIAWGILQPPPDEPVSLPPLVCTMASRQAGDSAAANREPVRFLGTSLLTGLAPASAGVGDIIIRFWNCDAAIVVRPTMPLPVDLETDLLDARLTYCRIVGRADIAETYERPGDGTDDMAKRLMDVLETSEEIEGMSFQQYSRGVYVRLDFATLQKISAAIHI